MFDSAKAEVIHLIVGSVAVPVIPCPACASNYRIDRGLVGHVLACPNCGTEWQVTRRTSTWRKPVIITLVIASPFLAFCALVALFSGGTGSPEEAIRLKPVVESIADPESGDGCDPEYYAQRFPDGSWVLGIGRDSHAFFHGGGTMVLKDSRGHIRCFFGHVCGPRGVRLVIDDARSVDDMYDQLIEKFRFTEYEWP
jgi:hypothetical protein